MVFYPQPVEESVELVLLGYVVILTHHRDEEALDKSSRTYEKEIVAHIFHHRQVLRFVRIVVVATPNLLEVRLAVWDSLNLCHLSLYFLYLVQKYTNILVF